MKYKTSSIYLRLALIILISFLSNFVNAQETDSVRIAIDNILAPLNKSLIPTGILAENSYPLLDLSTYNGQLTPENSIDFSQWRLLYNQALSGAYIEPVGLPDIDQLNIDYNTARNNGANNVVSLSLINYASIKPTAITDGLLTVSRGQLLDNNAGSPYQTNRLFLAAAVNNTARNGVLNLLFNPSLFYTNTGLTVTNLQVDFGNGNGFVTASFNTALSGVYTTIGNKQLIYKITFSDNSIAQCYNNVYVPYIPSSNNASRYGGAATTPTGADIPDVILNSNTNAHSGVDLFIRQSVSNNLGSNANPQFKKPLIIVEGLDLSSATTLLGNGYNYNDFLREIINPAQTSFTSGTNPLQPFDQYLDDVAGYDLIFVNWHNGVDDILRNVLALRDVINYVNGHKQPGAVQNVVLGISMGGLVSRYCLAQMVKAGGTGINDHQTRLLITHDSPHRGANVPLALQHLLQGLRKQKVKAFLGLYNKRLDEIIPQMQDINTAINSPAPTQQLLARVIDDNGTVSYNTFLDGTYRTMINFDGSGFTQPYRFVATSNGSQCGVPLAAPYSQLASLDAEGSANLFGLNLWTKGRAFLDMRALPQQGITSSILDFNLKLKVKFLVFNLLKISMQIQKNAPGNLLALDGLAGGTRSLGGAELSSTVSNIPPAAQSANWLIFRYSYNYTTPIIAPSFTFVPTTSSLDVADFTAVNIPYSIPITGLNGSRAANYIAQEAITLSAPVGLTYNVNHTDFYARTCNWLYNEMENIAQPYDCKYDCPTGYNTTITGPDLLCTNGTYNISNLNGLLVAGVTVSPMGIANVVLNPDNTITVSPLPNTSGFISLQTAVRIPGCNATNPISKQIYIGKPQPVTSITEYQTIGSNCAITRNFSLRNNGTNLSYTWYSACISPTPTAYINSGTGTAKSLYQLNPCDDVEGQFKIRVDATNTCGTTTGTLEKIIDFNTIVQYDYDCQHPPTNNTDFYFITISPNPVTTSTIIKIKYLPPPNPPTPAPSTLMTKLMVYNGANQLVTSIQLSNVSQYTLNTSFFTPGSYRVLVQSSSGEWLQATLIK